MTLFLSTLLVTGGFLGLAWDEKNTWKVLACAAIMSVGLMIQRSETRSNAYADGYKDATCYIYEQQVENGRKTVKSVEEHCDE